MHNQSCVVAIGFDLQNDGVLSVTSYLVLKSICVMSCSSISCEDGVKMLFTGSPLMRKEFGNQHCHVTHIDQLCHMGVSKGLLFYSCLCFVHIQFTKYAVFPLPFLEVRYYINTKIAVIDNSCWGYLKLIYLFMLSYNIFCGIFSVLLAS
jgi:hypothetical protein